MLTGVKISFTNNRPFLPEEKGKSNYVKKSWVFLFYILPFTFYFLPLNAIAQIPKFNSNSSAQATVYLDFDGHTVKGTSWNWDSVIHARPSGLKQAAITEIFNRVAEDYRIFNINITTDSAVFAKAPVARRIRVLITPTNKWYGEAGGVSFVGSFIWGDGTPSWVFSVPLQNNAKYIGEAASHEIGHTLGLQHQSSYNKKCELVTEYAEGSGDGEISWAPIMGNGYYHNLTTWNYGSSIAGCSVIQNDIEVISKGDSKAGIRTDDHANTQAAATAVTMSGSDFQATGMINTGTDKDVFKFVVAKSSTIHVRALPSHVATGNQGANLDIKLSLLKTTGDTIGRYNPPNLVSAIIDTNLLPGTYYIVVDGVANANITEYGSIGYYTIDGSIAQALPVTKLTLTGKVTGQQHLLNWAFEADEPVKDAIIEGATDGIHFTSLTTLQPQLNAFSYRPFGNGAMYYRVKMVTSRDERAYYSNILSLQYSTGATVTLLTNVVSSQIRVNVTTGYTYQLIDETGRLLAQGTLTGGTHDIAIGQGKKGLLFLKVYRQKEQHLFKLINQ